MEHEITEAQWQAIAGQLSCPEGEQGLETAGMMHKNNFGMTMASIDALDLENGDAVLELGPASCGHLGELLSRAENLSYRGLEISETMQREATEKQAAFVSSGQAEFLLYDGAKIPFEAEAFDKVMTVNTLYFWEKPDLLIREIYRVLKPGGAFALTFADKTFMQKLPFVKYRFRLYDREDVLALTKDLDWSVEFIGKTEQVESNAGQFVERDFSVAVIRKAP